MKRKNIWLILFVTFMLCSSYTIVSSKKVELNKTVSTIGSEIMGNTLIVENINKRVFEVDTLGKIVWQKTGLGSPNDAERLDNGNILISEFSKNRIIEIDTTGSIVWEYTGLSGPQDVERLNNGNTLITETLGSRIIEIDNFGNIIWEKAGLFWPVDAERIDNGNTLIVESLGQRIIEVDTGGAIVWQLTNLSNPVDVERLHDGTTLITEANLNRVILVDTWGNILREIDGLNSPWDAERLSNGDTLIAEFANNRIIQVDLDDEIVWQITGLQGTVDVERLPNLPPFPPEITGPQVGKMFKPIYYNFTSVDPNSDDISYYVEWGDGTNNNWSPWQNSGENFWENHTWYVPVNYTISAKAKDKYGEESEISIFEVVIPRNRIFSWFERLFENFPLFFQTYIKFMKFLA